MSAAPASQRVWPLWLRLGHWAGVTAVALTWLSGFGLWGSGELHENAGWVLVALLLARLLAGLGRARPGHWTRWAEFVRGPRATWAYLRALRQGQAPRHLGHNPLGAWMILALLATVAGLGLTGALLTTDAGWGDPDLAATHEALAWVLMGLVAGHLGGVALMSWRHRENLVAAMLSGRKRRTGDEADAPPPAA